MNDSPDYDVIVLGSGAAGLTERGRSAYEWFNGDRSRPGALDQAPFHAVELHSGALGTKGGPRTDADGQVLGLDGNPIPGLYAAGNAMGGATGMVYGGAGGTIGPAMAFGYRAGQHAGSAGKKSYYNDIQ